jgi:chromosome partitioning protein
LIFTILNQKGGVGKTTTAVTLGHGLALRGFRVLIVDLDVQGHVATSLGLEKAPDLRRLLSERQELHRCATQARENLYVIRSDHTTEAAKRDLVQAYFSEQILAKSLENSYYDYDVVLVDTAPSLDILQVAAIVAGDFLLIPSRLESLSMDGINEALRTYAEISMAGATRSSGYRVIPTFFDRVTRESSHQLHQLAATFGEKCWPPVPADTKAREAPAFGESLYEYAPATPALIGYAINGSKKLGGYNQILNRLVTLMRSLVNG